mmetsp:Transcript_81852/g.228035  ORF Transcript_81852/g.228035 Transcript_81852/m.228035 type:complete len:223 (+) Transcript_81852:1039-1707(+)
MSGLWRRTPCSTLAFGGMSPVLQQASDRVGAACGSFGTKVSISAICPAWDRSSATCHKSRLSSNLYFRSMLATSISGANCHRTPTCCARGLRVAGGLTSSGQRRHDRRCRTRRAPCLRPVPPHCRQKRAAGTASPVGVTRRTIWRCGGGATRSGNVSMAHWRIVTLACSSGGTCSTSGAAWWTPRCTTDRAHLCIWPRRRHQSVPTRRSPKSWRRLQSPAIA